MAQRAKGGLRGPRAPSAPFGGDGPRGAFGVIPKAFRMESHFERKVIMSAVRKQADRKAVPSGENEGGFKGSRESK